MKQAVRCENVESQPLKQSRTRWVATLGPASCEREMLARLMRLGVSTFRLNFSHNDQAWHRQVAKRVREVAAEEGCCVALLADLQGPKIRISSFRSGSVHLKAGDFFQLNLALKAGEGDEKGVGIEYRPLLQEVDAGDTLIFDDGRMQMRVVERLDHALVCEVMNEGTLSDFKGVNRRGGGLSAESLTAKDRLDLACAMALEVDFVAISFVKSAQEMVAARQLTAAHHPRMRWIAKIECATLLDPFTNFEEVLAVSDVIMVARGDLAIEIGDAALAVAQKRLIKASKKAGKPVIVATQVMESMIKATVPTRAEICDLSNAILDGADAIMFSAETAMGAHPDLVLQKACEIAAGVERSWAQAPNLADRRVLQLLDLKPSSISETLSIAAILATELDPSIEALLLFTSTAATVLYLASLTDLALPIVALSPSDETLRQTTLSRHVIPLKISKNSETSMETEVTQHLLKQGILRAGAKVMWIHGNHDFVAGGSNAIKLATLTDSFDEGHSASESPLRSPASVQ